MGVLSRLVPPGLVDEVVGEGGPGRAAAGAARAAGGVFRAGPGPVQRPAVGAVARRGQRPGPGAGRGGMAGPRGDGADPRAAPDRGEAAGAAVPAAVLGADAGAAPWSHIGGRLAVAWDGTTIKAPGSEENPAAFGRPVAEEPGCVARQTPTAAAAGRADRLRHPRAAGRGDRAPLAHRRAGPGRRAAGPAAPGDAADRRPRVLLLAAVERRRRDRRGPAVAGQGLDAPARGPAARRVVAVGHPRPRSRPAAPATAQRRRRGSRLAPDTGALPGITVRVIEFPITVTAGDGTARTAPYRLITTLTDPAAAPPPTWPPPTPGGGPSRPDSPSSRPTCAAPAASCAPAPPTWPARNYGPA